jgi:hypothetical protein
MITQMESELRPPSKICRHPESSIEESRRISADLSEEQPQRDTTTFTNAVTHLLVCLVQPGEFRLVQSVHAGDLCVQLGLGRGALLRPGLLLGGDRCADAPAWGGGEE